MVLSLPVSENRLTNGAPQFGTAEYAGSDRCKSCNQTVAGTYYSVNRVKVCSSCAERLKGQLPKDSHQAYARGLLFGGGGAVLGLVLYAAFGIVTGLLIGYVSLAVGYIVGKAIRMGSKGVGGRRYQVAAALLTYAAVSMAAIPMGIAQFAKQHEPQHLEQSQSDPGKPSDAPLADQGRSSPKSATGLAAALGSLALLGLASPFLELQDPIHGVIGLVILFVGIRIAWRMTAGSPVEVLGPFVNNSPSAIG